MLGTHRAAVRAGKACRGEDADSRKVCQRGGKEFIEIESSESKI